MDWNSVLQAIQNGGSLGGSVMSGFQHQPSAAPAQATPAYNGLAQPATAGPPSGATVQAATAQMSPYQQGLQLAQQQMAAAQPATQAGMAGGAVPAMPQHKQGGSAFGQLASLFM